MATGVLFDVLGLKFQIQAAKEVVLSAGALNSPQLLMLSGVGPEGQLHKYNINVVHHLPGVGANLQDHISTTGAIYTIQNRGGKRSKLSYTVQDILSNDSLHKFLQEHDGPLYSMSMSEVMGFWSSKYQSKEEDWPDVQFLLGLSLIHI